MQAINHLKVMLFKEASEMTVADVGVLLAVIFSAVAAILAWLAFRRAKERGEDFALVHQGIGEVRGLASDIKRVVSNVRTLGTFGETQLGCLLKDFLSPEQFGKNVQVKDNSSERVDFAIILPGRDTEVLLPVDSKCPLTPYHRLVAASQTGDAKAVSQAEEELERSIRGHARSISEKYISPPRTTDFAIMFLPFESLYVQVLERKGFFQKLQRELRVTLCGPTTLSAFINALHFGFRTLAVEENVHQIETILRAARTEYGRHERVADALTGQLSAALNSVTRLRTRTRAMDRALRKLERMPGDEADDVLRPIFEEAADSQERAGPDETTEK